MKVNGAHTSLSNLIRENWDRMKMNKSRVSFLYPTYTVALTSLIIVSSIRRVTDRITVITPITKSAVLREISVNNPDKGYKSVVPIRSIMDTPDRIVALFELSISLFISAVSIGDLKALRFVTPNIATIVIINPGTTETSINKIPGMIEVINRVFLIPTLCSATGSRNKRSMAVRLNADAIKPSQAMERPFFIRRDW